MTPIKVTIDTSINTENEVLVNNITGVDTDGSPSKLVKINVENSYVKFTGKCITTLRALALKKRFFYSYLIRLDTKKSPTEDIFIHVIKAKDGSTELFEPLKRLGIIYTELKIGFSLEHKKLYLSNKLLKDISKFSDEIKQCITMYFVSIAHMLTGIATVNPELSCEYSGVLNTNILNWEKYIYSFSNNETFEIAEIPTEDLLAIRYFNNIYSTPGKCTSVYPDNSYTIVENETSRHLVLSRDIDNNVFWVYNPELNKLYTNDSLSYMNLDYDTFAAGFTHAVGKTLDIMYVKDLSTMYFNKDTVYSLTTEVDEDTYESDRMIAKIINDYKSAAGIISSKLKKIIENSKACTGIVDKDAMIESYKDDEYAQQLYTQVQEYYDTFDLKALTPSIRGFANGDIYAMMFIGGAGTGKSTSARVIPYKCGIPYLSINFCVNIEESDLVGTMIPNPEKNSPEDPEFIWQDGLITKAVRNGYCVVLEEINFARPGVLGKLNSLLDEHRQIDLPNGEVLKAHPNFRMIATCNIAYEGTNRFNKALINRFEMVHEFKDLDKIETFKVLKSRIKGLDDVKLSKVYVIYELLKKYAVEQGLDIVISIRQLFNMFRQGKYYSNAYEAIMDILINGAFIELPEYKEKFVETIMKDMKKELSFKI